MTGSPGPVAITITFELSGSSARVRWEADVLGVRVSHFVSPYRGADIALVIRALDMLQNPDYATVRSDAQTGAFAFDQPDQERLTRLGLWEESGRVVATAPQIVGRALYRALTADPIGAGAMATARDHAAALGQQLALSLRFPPDALALVALPWELLWDEGPAPLLLSGSTTCARHLDLPQALPPANQARGPLRILAVAPAAGIPPALHQLERAARLRAWQPLVTAGRAQMNELHPATPQALLQAFEAGPPDVVHFYGHGRYHHGRGALLLDDPDGGHGWIEADALAMILRGAGLVVLHACQGAMVSSAGLAHGMLLSGVAPALSGAGIPAVVGMQFSVRSEAATHISAAIYNALALGRSVQEALSEARRAIYVAERDRVSWYIPVLYLRTRVVEPIYLRPPATRQPVRNAQSTQVIAARGGALIQAIRMRGVRGASQSVSADSGGSIVDARLAASRPSRQHLHAAEGGALADVDLSDQV